ncbi:MAG: hypothetical protein KC910_16355 [Candidatus Eremiobacteraeota bacterium]|nr:hypothetical protein [Candidatus Eremiobacteraeota bacterium]
MRTLICCLMLLLLVATAVADPQPLGTVEPWIQSHLESGDLENWYEGLEDGKDYTHNRPGELPEVYRKPSQRDIRHAVAVNNLNQAIKLLEERGATATASGLSQHYQSGQMTFDDLGTSNAETSNVNDHITVNLDVIHPNHDNKTLKEEQTAFAKRAQDNPDIDPSAAPTRTVAPSRFEPIDPNTPEGKVALLGLASTLYHEWIHVGQSRLHRIKSAARQANDHGNDAEMQAWLDTLTLLEKWIDAYHAAGQKEWELAAVDALLAKLQGLSENGDYYEGAFRSDMEKSRLTRQKLWTRYREMLVAEPVRTGKVFRGTYSGSSGQADSSREFLVGRPVEPPCGHF